MQSGLQTGQFSGEPLAIFLFQKDSASPACLFYNQTHYQRIDS